MAIDIAIDYRMCRSSGIGVYLRHVVRSLVTDHAAEFRITLLGGDHVPGVHEHRPCRSPIYSLAEVAEVPARIPRGTEVFWAPHYNAPFVSPGRLVVTVHDMNHLALPHLLGSRLKLGYSHIMFANVKRRADRILCPSQFTAVEAARIAGLDPARMTVIHHGLSAFWREQPTGARPRPEPYLLYVGNVKPHKNLGRLLQAFEAIRERVPHSLVIVGRREGFVTPDHEIGAAADRLGARVVFTGEVSDEALRGYYAHSDLLVYPSLYEGFGFPPLEAMASRVPVAAARAGSIPEVCGDAVSYFDPRSVDEMATVIERTLTDQALRSTLRERGLAQIERYTWSTTAARVATVFREVAAA